MFVSREANEWIAEEISLRQPVLYFDFEMSDKQFQLRYTDPDTGYVHNFSKNFIRVEFARDKRLTGYITEIVSAIGEIARERDAKVVIIDNLTLICNQSENGDEAGMLIQELVELKKKRGMSVLVLAHTPKRNISSPLNQNSLAGSKKLANFFDSIFAIGVSKVDKSTKRYVKQIKVRNGAVTCGEENVMTATIGRDRSFLCFNHDGYSAERLLLDSPYEDDIDYDKDQRIARRNMTYREIARRLQEKCAYRDIATELHVSNRTIIETKRLMESTPTMFDPDNGE